MNTVSWGPIAITAQAGVDPSSAFIDCSPSMASLEKYGQYLQLNIMIRHGLLYDMNTYYGMETMLRVTKEDGLSFGVTKAWAWSHSCGITKVWSH